MDTSMTDTVTLSTGDRGLTASLQAFLQSLLSLDDIRALLVPLRLPVNQTVMPALVTDSEALAQAAPLAPVFPLNAARLAARLTRKSPGGKIAAVLRPCEIRAFIELVKLKQGRTDELVLIGIDCAGACPNRIFTNFSRAHSAATDDEFCKHSERANNFSFSCYKCWPDNQFIKHSHYYRIL